VPEFSSISIKKVLKDFGLTEKEAEIYILLAKSGVLRGGEIVARAKKHRAQVYRILKILQTRGLVETTLEAPTRFTAVPFETFLDLNIRAKRNEAALIEKEKQELLVDWNRIKNPIYEPSLEKFSVIEGRNKISSKLLQIIKQAKGQLSALLTVPDIERADQFGILDAFHSHKNLPTQFRLLTELSEQNLNAIKKVAETKTRYKVELKGRDADVTGRLLPRMIIRDDAEILLWLSHKPVATILQDDSLCLWTNCKIIVQTFLGVFEEQWGNAVGIEQKIFQATHDQGRALKTDQISVIGNPDLARKNYEKNLHLAEHEIIMLTSSQGLVELFEDSSLLREWTERGVAVKIMAPITSENMHAAEKLSAYSEVRHIPLGYSRTTIVDGKNLFQFKLLSTEQEEQNPSAYLDNMFFTFDYATVCKTKLMLEDIWQNANNPPANTLAFKKRDIFKELIGYVGKEEPEEKLTEKDILDKISNSKRIPLRGHPAKYTTIIYGSSAVAMFHPPEEFGLEDMRIHIFHANKQSSFGAEDFMNIQLSLETPMGKTWVPVAHITDNPKSVHLRKVVWAGTPAAQNIQVLKNDELKVSVHGNTLFAGWTVPISLLPPKPTLPPCCIQFDGYGELETGIVKTGTRSGRQQTYEFNGLEAFVTLFHPSSKFSGPGTDGVLLRDMIMTARPPSEK
jgi:sugar-specific transcriptional regulator TrmB